MTSSGLSQRTRDPGKRPGTSRAQAKLYAAVVERDGGQCTLKYPGICTTKATTADHIIPWAKGGEDRVDNLRAACEPCNQHRNDHEDKITDADYHSKDWGI